jgi:alanine transaminase
LSYLRQTLSLVTNPTLLSNDEIARTFPTDILEQAKFILHKIKGVGAYTDSQGSAFSRQSIAKFIERRDKIGQVDFKNVFLSNGASGSISMVLDALLFSEKDTVMIPIPQYPLYSALLTLKGATAVGYFFESKDDRWHLDSQILETAILDSLKVGKKPKAIVVINPGNPIGQLLSYEQMVDIVHFCEKYGLAILADEVYQENVYDPASEFHSFRKVVLQLQSSVPVASLNSLSKGFVGECGLRGGYAEFLNWDPEVMTVINKLASIFLCSNTVAQVALHLMVSPPLPGSPSFQLYDSEKQQILGALSRKAKLLYLSLNKMSNIQCNRIEGAMYAFPEVFLSPSACQAASALGIPPDQLYCLEALERTGIVLVPGSGFGQKAGTHHFRITNLLSEEAMQEVMGEFAGFNEEFHNRYS